MQPLAQLADEMLTAAQILKPVLVEGSGKGGEGAHRIRGEIRGRSLEIAGHETGEGFVATHQIPEASIGLEPTGLLQGGEPGFQGAGGWRWGLNLTGTGPWKLLRWFGVGPPQGIQLGLSRPGRIERMSCSHSAWASCAWIRRWRRWYC